jgi:N-acetylglucosaminyldiphosphoundecaprenol N-acetyl-beta-D-mannosaminyltransferase
MKRTRPKRVDVAGVGFDPITQQQLIDSIAEYLRSRHKQSLVVVKPYVEFFTRAWADEKIRKLLTRADYVVADGVAVQWAASYLVGKQGFVPWLRSLLIDIQSRQWREQVIPERGAGVDATHKLLLRAIAEGWSVGIFGGPKDSERTQEVLKTLYPGLRLVGVWSGFYAPAQEPSIVEIIKKEHPDILFVAQGFPRQEIFIDSYRAAGLARVMIGEGGTFDFDSMGGNLKRAPRWMRKVGLEWLWRLIQQPSRWRRQLALPRFTWRIYKIGQQK